MPSKAYSDYLLPLLADATELEAAHKKLRTGQVGRQWGLGSLNRAAVVISLSAWEAFVEELLKEAVECFRPNAPHQTPWQAVYADARSQAGRFNTPNPDNVRRLFADSIGLTDVTLTWVWKNCTVRQAREKLSDALNYRHWVAHGVNPRPTIHNKYSRDLPGFIKKLGRKTDEGVRNYLTSELHVPAPWPP